MPQRDWRVGGHLADVAAALAGLQAADDQVAALVAGVLQPEAVVGGDLDVTHKEDVLVTVLQL